MDAFVTRTPSKKMRQMSLGGSAIETPLKTGYEGQPGNHSRVMHKSMSNLTNIAQIMPQGIKGPKRLLQQAAMEKWNEISSNWEIRPSQCGRNGKNINHTISFKIPAVN